MSFAPDALHAVRLYNAGNDITILTVSRLTRTTWPTNRTMYSGSSGRFGAGGTGYFVKYFLIGGPIIRVRPSGMTHRHRAAIADMLLDEVRTVLIFKLRSDPGAPIK